MISEKQITQIREQWCKDNGVQPVKLCHRCKEGEFVLHEWATMGQGQMICTKMYRDLDLIWLDCRVDMFHVCQHFQQR
jgi:hypothetical protein